MRVRTTFSGAFVMASLVIGGACLPAGNHETALGQRVSSFTVPAAFEPNRGQGPKQFDFTAQGFGYGLGISATHARVVLAAANKGGHNQAVTLDFPGANPRSQAQPLERFSHTANYYLGNQAFTAIPTYGRLRYTGVWKGIDVVYYGNQNQLEYDFVVAPGADPSAIGIQFQGAASVRPNASGDLVLSMGSHDLLQRRPVAYQMNGAVRTPVEARYVVNDGRVQVALGSYDRSRELVIDPLLLYAYTNGSVTSPGSFLSISRDAASVATDPLGLATYLVGTTVPLVIQQAGGAMENTAYMVEFDNTGKVLGSLNIAANDGNTAGTAVAVDPAGSIYVTGYTDSQFGLPIANALQTSSGGGKDAFLMKLTPSFSLLYLTYLGGSGDDFASGLAVNPSGVAYVVGQTTSTNWPVSGPPAGQNGFIYAIDTTKAGGPSKVYGAVIGGAGTDAATSVAVDANSSAYVGGTTNSNSAGFTPNVGNGFVNTKTTTSVDGFVVKFNSAGTAVWSTFFPNGPVNGIAQSSNQFAYITGQTTGAITTTAGAFQAAAGANHAFFADLDTTPGSSTPLVYSTNLGGGGTDTGSAITVGTSGKAYIAGSTGSPNFPLTGAPQIASFASGSMQVFLAYIDPSQSGAASLVYSTLLSGAGNTTATGIIAPVSGEVSVSATSQTSGGAPTGGRVWKIGSRIWDPTFYVTEQYLDLLQRNPDAGGLAFWINALVTGGETRSSLAAEYFISPEFSQGGLAIIEYYIAVLGRDPDFNGWASWMNQWHASVPLSSILASFVSSQEFQTRYGNLNNQQFVTLAYQNVLQRSPDMNGLNLYLGQLNTGTTRATVMGELIGSTEFFNLVRPRAYADLLYMGFLRRNPDPTGLQFWINNLQNPNNLNTVITNFVTSPEYVQRFF